MHDIKNSFILRLTSFWLLVLILLSAGACATNENNSVVYRQWVDLPNDQSIILVGVADTAAERAQGLSGREQMADNEGMWFVFDQPGIHSFWMKDMKFSVDIIWVDENYRITDITQNIPIPSGDGSLPTYQNTQPAKYVLEVNAGVSNGLTIGDQLALRSGI